MSLLNALQIPGLYDHSVEKFELIETHISWVLLTGQYVYKIKKPVDFGFLDFSTLEKRQHYCNEELRLNQRLAPQLYLDVVSITGSEQQPQINGQGEVIEYAVKMRQFPQSAQLDRLLAAGKTDNAMIDRLADKVSQFHLSIAASDKNSAYGDVDQVQQPMMDNFAHIRKAMHDRDVDQLLDTIEQWTAQQCEKLANVIQARKANGFIRECHGDMHLRNIALWDDEITIFDCIEFNPDLYWIDVTSEIAFLIMDLEDRAQDSMAQRFLNRYLEHTGDYEGLRLLQLYKVYRAMVRAKVDALRAAQEQVGSAEYQQTYNEFTRYLKLALRYIQPAQPFLLINYGLSGSGKSFTSRQIAEALPAIQLRSDIERKRLFDVPPFGNATVKPEVLYSAQASNQTYHHLVELARVVLNAGYTVIIDAANLHQKRRQQFVELAESIHVAFLILAFQADEAILKQRVEQRSQAGVDVSDANVTVLQQQLKNYEPIAANEEAYTLVIDTGVEINIDSLVGEVKDKVGTRSK